MERSMERSIAAGELRIGVVTERFTKEPLDLMIRRCQPSRGSRMQQLSERARCVLQATL